MHLRPKRTVYRDRNQNFIAKNFKLSSGDLAKIDTIRAAFEAHHDVSVSTSIILSLAVVCFGVQV